MSSTPAIIVGGGVTGLACAYQMVLGGVAPVLIECAARLGGVIQTSHAEGCVLEEGPDSFLAAKPAGAQLARELGLGNELIGSNDTSRVTYVVKQGRLVPLPDGLMMMVPTRVLPMALSPLLSWPTKMRMGLEYLKKPPVHDPGDRTVGQFIREHYGQEAVDYLAEPLLSGVYGGDVERLSVNSVLARFVEMESSHGSLTKAVLAARRGLRRKAAPEPLFQTLKGGLSQLTGELERRIRPSTRIIQARAEAVERTTQGGWRVLVGGDWIETRHVVLACPAWAAGALLKEVNGELSALLGGIEYSSSLTLALVYRREDVPPLPRGFGFLVPLRERRSLVACTFVGAKFPYRVPDSHVVLRCFLGGAGGEDILDLADEEIAGAVQAELEQLLGWRRTPAAIKLARWKRSMAQYSVGHESRIRLIGHLRAGLPGLHLAGNAYSGIGIPDCIRTGRAAAGEVAAALQSR